MTVSAYTKTRRPRPVFLSGNCAGIHVTKELHSPIHTQHTHIVSIPPLSNSHQVPHPIVSHCLSLSPIHFLPSHPVFFVVFFAGLFVRINPHPIPSIPSIPIPIFGCFGCFGCLVLIALTKCWHSSDRPRPQNRVGS